MENPSSTFKSRETLELETEFFENGFVIREVENKDTLDKLRNLIVEASSNYLGKSEPKSLQRYLDEIGPDLKSIQLNDLRLNILDKMQNTPWLKAAYYSLARKMLATLVGNELAMQKSINLSIQVPGDDSSLLPVHADVLNGASPFEVVLWIPLVDCYATKSMYILNPKKNSKILSNLKVFSENTSEELFKTIKNDVSWLTVPYGSYLIFTQNLLHGNRVNKEAQTRWSMNCRFKSLLSPYSDKKFGEFFEPITIRAATRLGMKFQTPDMFDEV